MIDHPSRPLEVVQVADPGDPAIDYDHGLALADPAERRTAREALERALTDYRRARTQETLAKIPMRATLAPRRWLLRPLGMAARTIIEERAELGSDASANVLAFRVACHQWTDADGVHVCTDVESGRDGVGLAPFTWVDRCAELAGGQLIDELGSLARQRARVAPHALDPFGLPRGLALRL